MDYLKIIEDIYQQILHYASAPLSAFLFTSNF